LQSRRFFEVEDPPLLVRFERRDFPHSLASERDCDPQDSSVIRFAEIRPTLFTVNDVERNIQRIATFALSQLQSELSMASSTFQAIALFEQSSVSKALPVLQKRWHWNLHFHGKL